MPWNTVLPMDQKKQLVADYHRDVLTVDELAERYGVSRKTIYKWVDRFTQDGQRGLEVRSRRPHHSPHRTPDAIVEEILVVQRRHGWGAKKLRSVLMRRDPRVAWPSVATFTTISRTPRLCGEATAATQARSSRRAIVAARGAEPGMERGFQGPVQDAGRPVRCYPLTVTDNYSRYLLGCQGLRSTACASAKRACLCACFASSAWRIVSGPTTGCRLRPCRSGG